MAWKKVWGILGGKKEGSGENIALIVKRKCVLMHTHTQEWIKAASHLGPMGRTEE